MKQPLCLVFALFFSLLLSPGTAPAQQDRDDSSLHVLRSVMHAEQDLAELCLETDRPLTTLEHPTATATVKLEQDGRVTTLAQKNISIANSEICIPGLKHRKDYRLTLSNLRAMTGEKLGASYTLRFTVPERQPALVFVNNARNNGMMHWTDDGPVLRSVNVAKVKLELFRITDPARMAEAWGNRLQTTLAPSESATFAHANGSLSWQGTMNVDATPDEIEEQQTPLTGDAMKLPPGLYLVIASAPELRQKETDLAPIAATWLLRSDLSLQAMRDGNTVYTILEQNGVAAKDVHVSVVGKSQQTITDAKTGEDGVVKLISADDKAASAATVMALTDSGDAAFADVGQGIPNAPVLPAENATIRLDRKTYMPGDNVSVTLTAHEIHGGALNTKGSTLQIMRPDGSVYAGMAVPDTLGAEGVVAFVAPVGQGIWPVVWRRADGTTLATAKLRVSSNPAAPHLELTTDTALLDESGDANVTVKSTTLSGASMPFISGRVFATWGVPDHVFPDWPDYRFGAVVGTGGNPVSVASFITDATGIAHLHIKLSPPNHGAALIAAVLRASGDTASGALDAPDLILPVRPKNIAVGIKPQEAGGHFPENSLARFDILILDRDGKRSDADDLNYQILEQGRSFDWYQSDGYWQYKPLEQHRRVVGGEVEKGADGRRHVEWPVAAGTYQLQITDDDNNRLAEMNFSAGYGAVKQEKSALANLDLTAVPDALQTGHDQYVRFVLPKPAFITAVIADEHVRKLIHAAMPAGENQIIFAPQPDWGVQVRVHATVMPNEKNSTGMEGDIIIPSTINKLAAKDDSKASATSWPVIMGYDGDVARLSIVVQQNIDSNRMSSIAGDKERKNPHIVLAAAQPFYNLPALLTDLFQRYPLTTQEVVGQLDTMRLWPDVIVGTHLMTEAGFHHRRDELLARLLQRQMPDGGFIAEPGAPEDIISTSTATAYLAQIKDAVAKPAREQAIAWLHHSLENTWFEEQDRPMRAAAYSALAGADALDIASLRFYGDSSPDKLPPLAAAQLALAFAHLNDRGSAEYWLSATHVSAATDIDPELLSKLASNNFYPVDTIKAQLAKKIEDKNFSLLSDVALLRAIWKVHNRSNDWRASFNGMEKNSGGVEAIAMPEKGAALEIRNLTNHALYVMEVEAVDDTVHSSIMRHIYRPDGGEMNGNLRAGEVYLVMLEGLWPQGEKGSIFVHDDIGPGLQPVGCTLMGRGGDGFLAWMPELTPVQNCESATDALSVVLAHPVDSGNWRVAYMARAIAEGGFDPARPLAIALTSGDMSKGQSDHINIH